MGKWLRLLVLQLSRGSALRELQALPEPAAIAGSSQSSKRQCRVPVFLRLELRATMLSTSTSAEKAMAA